MKKMGDMLLRRDAFSEIVMGNTAIVRAMVEAGTRVVSSYPGSPTPEIALAIQSIPKNDRPFYFEFSTNEKVATEVADEQPQYKERSIWRDVPMDQWSDWHWQMRNRISTAEELARRLRKRGVAVRVNHRDVSR